MDAMQDAHSQSPSGQEAAPPSLMGGGWIKSKISVWILMVMVTIVTYLLLRHPEELGFSREGRGRP